MSTPDRKLHDTGPETAGTPVDDLTHWRREELLEYTECVAEGFVAIEHCNGDECRDPDGFCEHCGCCICTPCEYARHA